MNKGIIIAISIAIIVGIFGISLMSMEPEALNMPDQSTENNSEPKRYSASLSENIGISTP